jgi:hypothetical protein
MIETDYLCREQVVNGLILQRPRAISCPVQHLKLMSNASSLDAATSMGFDGMP